MGGRALRLGWDRGPEHTGGRELRLRRSLEVAAREIAYFGSCHLGKCHWEVSTWEKIFRKGPNIV